MEKEKLEEKLKELKQFVDKKRIEISLNENDYIDNEEVIDILDDILSEIDNILK
ncbi:unclassified [Brachyspira pilosicoli WesB]|uniref:Unclassified n=1 Tax=Brachyspira pilosicoli WesB TaxID=1161918 RepID=K0JF40_BRAPL|nr:hypothetical protein [Brachyspira pilosicoli]CCG55788.1 unclassified [Brachyspira pilosicoli WesB]